MMSREIFNFFSLFFFNLKLKPNRHLTFACTIRLLALRTCCQCYCYCCCCWCQSAANDKWKILALRQTYLSLLLAFSVSLFLLPFCLLLQLARKIIFSRRKNCGSVCIYSSSIMSVSKINRHFGCCSSASFSSSSSIKQLFAASIINQRALAPIDRCQW